MANAALTGRQAAVLRQELALQRLKLEHLDGCVDDCKTQVSELRQSMNGYFWLLVGLLGGEGVIGLVVTFVFARAAAS